VIDFWSATVRAARPSPGWLQACHCFTFFVLNKGEQFTIELKRRTVQSWRFGVIWRSPQPGYYQASPFKPRRATAMMSMIDKDRFQLLFCIVNAPCFIGMSVRFSVNFPSVLARRASLLNETVF
jgi:hypothetical protein